MILIFLRFVDTTKAQNFCDRTYRTHVFDSKKYANWIFFIKKKKEKKKEFCFEVMNIFYFILKISPSIEIRWRANQ